MDARHVEARYSVISKLEFFNFPDYIFRARPRRALVLRKLCEQNRKKVNLDNISALSSLPGARST